MCRTFYSVPSGVTIKSHKNVVFVVQTISHVSLVVLEKTDLRPSEMKIDLGIINDENELISKLFSQAWNMALRQPG